jgi:YbbR domain-containing protein
MGEFIKEKIIHNYRIKIFAIIFSILFWVYVMDQINPIITKELSGVRVELLNLEYIEDNELLIMNNKEFFVDIFVEGRRDEILQLKTEDISLTSDLMGYSSGMNAIKINSKSYNREVEIKKLSQDEIKIELEKLVEKPKPVEIEFAGELDDGYYVRKYEAGVKEILVKGPESKVNSVKYVTGIYNLNGRKTNSTGEVIIVAVDDENEIIRGLNIDKKYVDVSVEIVKQKEVNVEIEIEDKTTDEFNLKNYSYYPKTVLIEGPEKIINAIENVKTRVIDITDDLGTFSLNGKIIFPDAVQLSGLGENIINVYGEVEEVIIKEYEMGIDSIAILNLDKEYTFKVINEIDSINIRMKAPKSVLDDIKKSDIELQIDASDFIEGLNKGALKLNIDIDEIEFTLSEDLLAIEINKIIIEE